MILSAYTISREPVKWLLPISHLNNCEPVPKWQEIGPKEYVKRLAEKRNRTIEALLEMYPQTSHILCCDEYYINQIPMIQQLIADYPGGKIVLGGAVWGRWRYRVSDLFHCSLQWADKWTVSLGCYHHYKNRTDFLPVKAVTGIHIMPAELRYGSYDNTNLGTEMTWMCQHSGLDCFLDLNTFFSRDKSYSIAKCVRCSIGLRSRLAKLRPPKASRVSWYEEHYGQPEH